MSTEGLRKCCHCKIWFKPKARKTRRQRFCLKLECQAASKRASQQKWFHKNPGYFHGEQYVKKVQAWRRNHPGYWKAKGSANVCEASDALQDLLKAQGFTSKDVKAFRNCLSEEISRPLQDLMKMQQLVLKGLASMITGETLQEDIARVLTTCYECGQRIDGPDLWRVEMSQMQTQEVKYERTRTDCTATAATHSPAVQLGRSPPDP